MHEAWFNVRRYLLKWPPRVALVDNEVKVMKMIFGTTKSKVIKIIFEVDRMKWSLE